MAEPPYSHVDMDTSRIESMIAMACAEPGAREDLGELLVAVADNQGNAADPGEIEFAVEFVCRFLEMVPYMIKVAWTAAGNVGLERQMRQILEIVQSYWLEDNDVIPDNLGVIGILDDAYCSLTSLQAVSDHYQLQTGKYLFPDNLTSANRAMRKIIGEPYASELDRMVIATMRDSGVVDAVKAMADPEKKLHFANQSTIWNHGPAGALDVRKLEQLGLLDD
jgi:uncharacterized membrane protein YkvA (DUF1232 family)